MGLPVMVLSSEEEKKILKKKAKTRTKPKEKKKKSIFRKVVFSDQHGMTSWHPSVLFLYALALYLHFQTFWNRLVLLSCPSDFQSVLQDVEAVIYYSFKILLLLLLGLLFPWQVIWCDLQVLDADQIIWVPLLGMLWCLFCPCSPLTLHGLFIFWNANIRCMIFMITLWYSKDSGLAVLKMFWKGKNLTFSPSRVSVLSKNKLPCCI